MEVEDAVDIVDLGAHYGPPTRYSAALNLTATQWDFDSGFASNIGVSPLEAPEGVETLNSFDGSAVRFLDVPASGVKFPDRDASRTYLDLREGTISFWYKPDWSTSDAPCAAELLARRSNEDCRSIASKDCVRSVSIKARQSWLQMNPRAPVLAISH